VSVTGLPECGVDGKDRWEPGAGVVIAGLPAFGALAWLSAGWPRGSPGVRGLCGSVSAVCTGATAPSLGGAGRGPGVAVWSAARLGLVACGRRVCRGVRAVAAGSGLFLPGVLPTGGAA